MAKKAGLDHQFFVHGYDLSGDASAINRAASPRGVLPSNGLNKSAMERLLSSQDGLIDFNTWFNKVALAEHVALSGLVTTDRVVCWAHGATIGNTACSLNAKQVNYDWDRGQDMSLAGQVECLGDGNPLEWGKMLTAGKITDASAANGASLDNAASSPAGAAAYLQVMDIDSGTPTVVVQDSPNDSAWSTLISFTAVADGGEPTAERKEVSGTVDRYLRAITTGSFSNLDYFVMVRRGEAVDKIAYA